MYPNDVKLRRLTLVAGKASYNLDLNEPKSRKRLIALFEKADVSLTKCLELAARRGKGIVYLDKNYYDPDGYYAERPGWQQVADRPQAAGVSWANLLGIPMDREFCLSANWRHVDRCLVGGDYFVHVEGSHQIWRQLAWHSQLH
ncbi:hypothetical protein F5Y03DRAFT_399293 [Xylaria venustula]|nr:hypothetical protein F5Y03DRAFT_399293 [Xylaria venustula]